MSKRNLVIGIALAVIVLSICGVWFINYSSLQKPLQQVLASDSRNQGVQAKAYSDGWFSFDTLVFDVTDVASTATRADVFRVFLQYANAIKTKHLTKVVLACRGEKKFTLDGSYFRQLGEEYSSQNPMYTIRTFPTHLSAMDGSKPFSEYTGGVLGVLQKELEQFSDFNDRWYVRSLASAPVSSPASSAATSASPSPAPAAEKPEAKSGEWYLLESKNEMDSTPKISLSKTGSDGAILMIRCAGRETDAFVNTHVIVDNGSVRVRFDDSPPARQSWSESKDNEALFSPDAVTFSRNLAKAHNFLFEFNPYRKTAKTITFDVTGLDSKLQKISDACNWDAIDKRRAKAKADANALRDLISPYVHVCTKGGKGWCYSDPDFQPTPGYEMFGGSTKEEALQTALENAKLGVAFKSVMPKK
jgi:hypothetical protein